MRRRLLGCIAWGVLLCQGGFAAAQSSLDALDQELKAVKQEHQEVTLQMLTNFFSQIDAAMADPDASLALYQQAGGVMPDPTPVVTEHTDETASEKAARLAKDQAKLARLGTVLQLHCGLMHYAALFVVKPEQKGLQGEWLAWLPKAAQIYPQLAVPSENSDQTSPDQTPHSHKWKKNAQDNPPGVTPVSGDMKTQTMRDSIIGKFLGFNAWDDKELNAGGASGSSSDGKDPGGWSVKDLPKLYRANVLEPLRASPTPATLAAWDAYIAMANTDEPDNDKWNQVDYPPLEFDRACDDYAVTPSTEKLEGLVNLIKANPTNPQADDWISRVHKMMDDYRAHHGGNATEAQSPAPASSSPIGNPDVNVTTEQQGDMTIITTHTNTNSAPVTNTSPTP
jgi:hypothetical protein